VGEDRKLLVANDDVFREFVGGNESEELEDEGLGGISQLLANSTSASVTYSKQ
jgi:hypothetical protein